MAEPDPPTYLPRLVRNAIDDCVRDLNVTPTVDQPDPRTWIVTAATSRVVAAVTFRLTAGNRARRAAHSLTVDGTHRSHGWSMEDLIRLFRDPDTADQPATLPPMPPEAPPEQAPGLVRGMYSSMLAAAARGNGALSVQLGRSGNRWTVCVSTPDGTRGARVNYVRTGRRWQLDPTHPIQVIVDGQDRSAEVGGDISQAMALLVRDSPPTPGAPPIPGAAPAARNNSVETRRATVIRN